MGQEESRSKDTIDELFMNYDTLLKKSIALSKLSIILLLIPCIGVLVYWVFIPTVNELDISTENTIIMAPYKIAAVVYIIFWIIHINFYLYCIRSKNNSKK